MVIERVEGEKRSARHNRAMCSSAAHAHEAGGDMAGRCTGWWCARTVERELPPVAERHSGSGRTAAAAGCQRAGGYGAGLGTLAAAAAVLVMTRGGWTAREAKSLRRECGWSKIPSPRVRSARPKLAEEVTSFTCRNPLTPRFLFSPGGAAPDLSTQNHSTRQHCKVPAQGVSLATGARQPLALPLWVPETSNTSRTLATETARTRRH